MAQENWRLHRASYVKLRSVKKELASCREKNKRHSRWTCFIPALLKYLNTYLQSLIRGPLWLQGVVSMVLGISLRIIIDPALTA